MILTAAHRLEDDVPHLASLQLFGASPYLSDCWTFSGRVSPAVWPGFPNGEIIMRYALCVAVGLLASCSAHMPPRHYVDVVNDGQDAVVSLSVATAGSTAWQPQQLGSSNGGTLEGGYMGDAMLAMPDGQGCIYDVLVEFAHQKALLIKAVNVCKVQHLHIGRAWQKANLQGA